MRSSLASGGSGGVREGPDALRVAKSVGVTAAAVGATVWVGSGAWALAAETVRQLYWRHVQVVRWGDLALEAIVVGVKGVLGLWGVSWLNDWLLEGGEDEEDLKKYL